MSSYLCSLFVTYWVKSGTETGGRQNQIIWESVKQSESWHRYCQRCYLLTNMQRGGFTILPVASVGSSLPAY